MKVLTDGEIQMMSDRELSWLIWDTFGVAIDFDVGRKELIKTLWRLSS